MSESVARTAAVEDCIRIMLASDKICSAFKEAGRGHINFAQFGSITGRDGAFALELLNKYRDNWEAHKNPPIEHGFRSAPAVPKSQAESILAFVLGWLVFQAVNKQLKPASPEAGLYQDAYVFPRRYGNNNNTPAAYRTAEFEKHMAVLPDSASISSSDVSELFRDIQQRLFIEMHTFVPDGDDIEGWFDRLDAKLAEWNGQLEQYAEVIVNPDADKVKQWVADANFYNDEDAIIQLAQSLRRGAQPTQAEIDAALESQPSSDYGRALKQGLGHLLSASAFFTGGIEQQELNEQLAG
jgi:hypothetical protein